MTHREYTVEEIDALRAACEMRWLYGSANPEFQDGQCSRSFEEAEKAAAVEQMVRTHILAGHTQSDLIKADGGKDGLGYVKAKCTMIR